jgi:hypothetical protein
MSAECPRSGHRGWGGAFGASKGGGPLAVAETNEDLMALIGAAESFPGAGFLVPTRNGGLMRWSLGEGLRINQTMTLMTRGLDNQPVGAWLPSVLY